MFELPELFEPAEIQALESIGLHGVVVVVREATEISKVVNRWIESSSPSVKGGFASRRKREVEVAQFKQEISVLARRLLDSENGIVSALYDSTRVGFDGYLVVKLPGGAEKELINSVSRKLTAMYQHPGLADPVKKELLRIEKEASSQRTLIDDSESPYDGSSVFGALGRPDPRLGVPLVPESHTDIGEPTISEIVADAVGRSLEASRSIGLDG